MHAKRDAQGRVCELITHLSIQLGSLEFAAGSKLEFNGEPYLDPRREDLLKAVYAANDLRLFQRIDVPAQTRISFSETGDVVAISGKLGTIQWNGFFIDGDRAIGFDMDGEPCSFTLGQELKIHGGHQLSVGTIFSVWPKMFDEGPYWYCVLGGAVALPEINLEWRDAIVLDKATMTMNKVFLNKPISLDNEVLSASAPIDVFPDGRINYKKVRKSGVLRGKTPM